MRHRCAAAALLLALAACDKEEEGDALMRPGENCLSCHAFGAAGTVYASAGAAAGEGVAGATVELVGPSGSDTVTTNAAGNFYSRVRLGSPLDVSVSRNGVTRTMSGASAGCAASGCHGPALRVHVP